MASDAKYWMLWKLEMRRWDIGSLALVTPQRLQRLMKSFSHTKYNLYFKELNFFHFQVRHFFQSSPFGGSLVLQNPTFSTNTTLLSKSIPKSSAEHPKAEEIKKSSNIIFNNKWIILNVISNAWILKWWRLTNQKSSNHQYTMQ